ncbi:hypothetical protein BKI52_09555 [marine bacterium AO1-C]|nr:hypothetical protein BKI52_09555 [marine bacterium AO1-C]
MKQMQQQSEWEVQSNELWQIYFNRQQFGNEHIPFPVFENRFWQHYDHLRHNVQKGNDLVPAPLAPQKDRTYDYGIQQDLNTILRKYWRSTQKFSYKKTIQQNNNQQLDLDGCIVPAALIIFGIVSFVLIAIKLFAILFAWVILGIGLLTLNDSLTASKKAQITLLLGPDFIAYQGTDDNNQPLSFDLFYKDIYTSASTSEGLTIIGYEQGNYQEILVPESVQDFYYLQKFIKEVVSYNRFRK